MQTWRVRPEQLGNSKCAQLTGTTRTILHVSVLIVCPEAVIGDKWIAKTELPH